ncbi:MAG: hypothetical protein ABI422_07120 [Sphingomicrobium sp.]
MDAYLTDGQNPNSSFDRPPILIAGDSEAALDRASRTIEASGLRIADRVGLEEAAERIDRQAAASALWVELDADHGPLLDRLLDHVNQDVEHGRYPAIVAARPSCSMRSRPGSATSASNWWSTEMRPIERPRWRLR